MLKKRSESVDFMRSIAIVIMIFANSFAYFLDNKSILWLRILFSLAAPLFIFLSGYSFYVSFCKKNSIGMKLKQVILLFISSVFIDVVIWDILPFQTFDVLYLIATSILINVLILIFNWKIKLIFAILIIIITPFLISKFNYQFSNEELKFNYIFDSKFKIADLFKCRRFLIDGWFPVFPWIAISIIGNVAANKSELIGKFIGTFKWLIIVLFFICLYFVFNQKVQLIRKEYMEIFYPAYPLFLSLSLLFILLLIYTSEQLNYNLKFVILFCTLGRNSLFVYMLHLIIISNLINVISPSKIENNVLLSLIILITVFISSNTLELIQKNKKLDFIPYYLKKIFGI